VVGDVLTAIMSASPADAGTVLATTALRRQSARLDINWRPFMIVFPSGALSSSLLELSDFFLWMRRVNWRKYGVVIESP